VPNPSRKEIARSLREAGNPEAALAVLLDFTPRANGTADNDGEGAPPAAPANGLAQDANGEPVLTHAQLKSLSGPEMERLMFVTPGGKALVDRSMKALGEKAAS
jgi:hypothetical protein